MDVFTTIRVQLWVKGDRCRWDNPFYPLFSWEAEKTWVIHHVFHHFVVDGNWDQIFFFNFDRCQVSELERGTSRNEQIDMFLILSWPILDTLQKLNKSQLVNVDHPITKRHLRLSFYPSSWLNFSCAYYISSILSYSSHIPYLEDIYNI